MKFHSIPIIILSLLLHLNIFSQEKSFIFLPGDLQFMPLKANHQEARIGVLYYTANSHLKVDIGNNIDILKFRLNEEWDFNLGIEFMAYAYSTNYEGKRLQIDAVDGFFGGHTSFEYKYSENTLKGRFRIIHNSAHFVDGHYDSEKGIWINDTEPIPFTQDFGELTLAHLIGGSDYGLMYYASISYATLVRPALIKKYSFSAGFEIHSNKLLGKFLDEEVNIFFANHNRYAGMPDYKISTSNMLGVKFGGWNSEGVVLYASYYYGNDVFNQYYYLRDNWFGIGFFVDFL